MPKLNLLNSAHKDCYYATIVIAAATLLVTIVLNVLAAIGTGAGAFFLVPVGGEADRFTDEVMPAEWAFLAIWTITYLWQLTWMGYAVSTLFRTPQYYNLFPEMMPIWLYFFYVVNLALNIAWLFLDDIDHLPGSFVILALMAFTLYICLFLSYRQLNRCQPQLQDEDSKEGHLVQLLVQNGLSFYATWATIATPLNFVSFLNYYPNVAVSLSTVDKSTIPLAIIAVEMTAYAILETFVFVEQLSSTFTPWIVVAVSMTGILTRRWSKTFSLERIPLFALILLISAVVFLITKAVLIVVRRRIRREMTRFVQVAGEDSRCY